jgi:hypothetical protein
MKRIPQVLFVLTVLLAAFLLVNSVAFSQKGIDRQENGNPLHFLQLTPFPDNIFKYFMPLIDHKPTYSLTGQVVDASKLPMANVTVMDNTGHSAQTDSNGRYVIDGLTGGNHTVAPSKDGFVFWPSVASVNLPFLGGHDFTALQACTDVIVNGSFETDDAWQFPITPYPAGYSTAIAHTGTRSARTGIISDVNVYSYSSTRQLINIPSDTASATLGIWLYPISTETNLTLLPAKPTGPTFGNDVLANDVQYVLVLDPGANPEDPADDTLLQTLLWTKSNAQQWMYYEFNLNAYIGRTIKIQAGTYNDGYGGITGMYVDDVFVNVCPTGEATATPSVTTTAAACGNYLNNPGFEYAGYWDIPITPYPAGYTNVIAYAGSYSMRTGVPDVSVNTYSYSDAGQWVTIPSGTTSAVLSLWMYPVSGDVGLTAVPPTIVGKKFDELALTSDLQYVLVLDQYSNIIDYLFWDLLDTQKWTNYQFDLSAYAGQTIKIQFGTFNDGLYGASAMYVDEIYLNICTGVPVPTITPTLTQTPVNTPTPTATLQPGTPSPTPFTCYDGIVNGGFETVSAWEIPITEFSAGYTTAIARTGLWSMRTGIPDLAFNRYSYSDFRQTVTIPVGATSAQVGMYLYPVSGETGTLSAPPKPEGPTFGLGPLAGDVQYVLVLDYYGNWIDTLVWQLSNSQTWTYNTYDLTVYAGSTIKLQFGTYNDGFGGVTAMYVDDVSMQICP